MAESIYALCATASLLAAFLLLRHYSRRRTRLLFWSFIAHKLWTFRGGAVP